MRHKARGFRLPDDGPHRSSFLWPIRRTVTPAGCRRAGVRCDAVSTEEVWRSLQQVNEWIRFADAKAGAVLAGSGLLGGFIVGSIPTVSDFKVHTTRAVLIGVAIVCLGASSLITLRILAPRLRTGEPRSLIYFDHIARRYENDCKTFVTNYLSLVKSDDDLSRQVAEQVWSNSRVARRKFRRVSYAIWSLGGAMISSGLAVIVQRVWNW